jgi:hypothetical protein
MRVTLNEKIITTPTIATQESVSRPAESLEKIVSA